MQCRLCEFGEGCSRVSDWTVDTFHRTIRLFTPCRAERAWQMIWIAFIPAILVAATGEQLTTIDFDCAVLAIAFSPDGKTLATAEYNGAYGTLKLWDTVTWQQRSALKSEFWIGSLAFSNDGKVLAGGGGVGNWSVRGIVVLWNAETWMQLATLKDDESMAITSVALSPDGNALITGGLPALKFWDVTTHENLAQIDGKDPYPFAYSSKAGLLAFGGLGGSITLWDIASWNERAKLKTNSVFAMSFSPDGRTLVSGGRDERIRWWDTASGTQRRVSDAGADVYALAFSPDGKTLASAGGPQAPRIRSSHVVPRHKIRLWDVATGNQRAELSGHDETIPEVTFCASGQRLASRGDRTVKVWRVP